MRSQLKEKTLTSICYISQHSANFLLSCLLLLRSVFPFGTHVIEVKDSFLSHQSHQDISNISVIFADYKFWFMSRGGPESI